MGSTYLPGHFSFRDMKAIQYWFIIESIHFFLGLIGCVFLPDTVMEAYSLFPKVDPDEKAYEMMHVVAMYYLSFVALSVVSIGSFETAFSFAHALVFFYGGLFVYDVYDVMKIGYQTNTGRYGDTAVHVIFGLIALGFVIYYKLTDSGKKKQKKMV